MHKITKIDFYDPIYRKNGLKAWPCNIQECQLALCFISSYSNLTRFLNEQPFCYALWAIEFEDWSFKDFAFSALYFYFEEEGFEDFYFEGEGFEEEDIADDDVPFYSFSYTSWFILITFLLNVETTQEIYFILEKNKINKHLLRHFIILGVISAFEKRTFPHLNITCLENLLNFLEIDKSTIQYLLKSFQEKKSLTVIHEFILANKTMILTGNKHEKE